jgi:cytochrome c oxidase assembly protein subunit 15
MAQTIQQKWLHRYATFVATATFFLIIAGALVTSNDAGLSVPDWPTSFGTFRMPRMVGGVKFEHGHRMVAGTVVIFTLILALWLWRSEPRRWVRRLGAISVLTILAQAILGGITVLFFLPVDISVAHACLAQAFFCIMVSLALFTGADWRWDEPKVKETSAVSLRRLATVTTVLIFIQLMMGAAFRHHGFGIIPHVVGAGLVTIAVVWMLVRVLSEFRSESRLTRSIYLLTGLLVAQVALGVGSYWELWTNQNPPQPMPPVVLVTTAHVAVGALVLAASLAATFQAYRFVAAPDAPPELSSMREKVAV